MILTLWFGDSSKVPNFIKKTDGLPIQIREKMPLIKNVVEAIIEEKKYYSYDMSYMKQIETFLISFWTEKWKNVRQAI